MPPSTRMHLEARADVPGGGRWNAAVRLTSWRQRPHPDEPEKDRSFHPASSPREVRRRTSRGLEAGWNDRSFSGSSGCGRCLHDVRRTAAFHRPPPGTSARASRCMRVDGGTTFHRPPGSSVRPERSFFVRTVVCLVSRGRTRSHRTIDGVQAASFCAEYFPCSPVAPGAVPPRGSNEHRSSRVAGDDVASDGKTPPTSAKTGRDRTDGEDFCRRYT